MAKNNDRRNSDPSQVRIMGLADFDHLDSLDARVDALVENRNEIAVHNIEAILHKHGIAQAYMCNIDLEGSPQPPQMAAYKKVGRDIPFRLMARVGMAYGYTPEQMFGQLLDQAQEPAQDADRLPPRPYDEHMKYVGTYHMAYFCTDAKLGGNRRSTARALSYGVLSIYPGNTVDGIPSLHVAAFINCTEEERDTLIRSTRSAEALGGGPSVRSCYEKLAMAPDPVTYGTPRLKCFYQGRLTLTERMAEITMRQVRGSDVAHINLHNRAAISSQGSPYKGGLAAMLSTSRGEEHMPCVQALILSKRGFAGIAKEELADLLFLEPPKVDLGEETKAIVAYMKALFPVDDADNPLSQFSDADKAFILESYIQRKLTEVIKRNVLGYYKISTGMDSDIYKALCR